MAKYQAYAEYKDSGVEWLGEIPCHWDLKPIKYLFEIINGSTPKSGEEAFWDGEITWITPSDLSKLRSQVIGESIRTITKKGLDSCGTSLVPSDTIILSCRAPIGSLAVTSKEACTNQGCKSLVKKYDLSTKFFYYYLSISTKQLNNLGRGTTFLELSSDELGSYALGIPNAEEQTQIANFLDHETAKIDTLIAKQEKLIELLKEKRQAVISHAVTKGLNPNVKMKDSGVEWLGEVPEHWDIVQAKYIADITRGAILRPVDAPEYFDEEGEWAYLNISDATKCDKYLDESKLRLSQLGSTKSARVYPNNLIITASATIGKAFINRIKVCVHDGFIPFCNIKLDINYLYHYVSNPYLYAAMGKSNTQKNIYLDEVKNMMVTVPPRCEQVAIVKHIESSQFKYDGLIQSANSAIKLMQERRTALISAAVTGKIDVRNWQAPSVTEADTELSA
ncbi:restriction endonuclease subunit S [Acinetobacter indicus]|uniref:restriction endonuclease subunit S n=1 Tax=Acinetobacter indicus TaxID=756892 RepID=UPI0014448D59|nr:restriction endonuclease subunit S [Acinetobacter indicus]